MPTYTENQDRPSYEVFKERLVQARDTLEKAKSLEQKSKINRNSQ